MLEYLKLIRPVNCTMTAIAVYIGAVIAGATVSLSSTNPVILGMVSAFLICAGGMSINDYFDVKADKINKRRRPVAKGTIKKGNALLVAVLLSVLGLIAAYQISIPAFQIAILVAIVLFAYSFVLKKIVFIGNVAISSLVALSFIYGAVIGGAAFAVFYLALLAFFSNMGREIYKDIEDVMGDKKIGRKTLPLRIGILKAKMKAIPSMSIAPFSFVSDLKGSKIPFLNSAMFST